MALSIGLTACQRDPDAPSSRTSPQQSASRPAPAEENIERALAAANEYLQSDDTAKARAILLTLIDRAPREVRAHELLGQTFTIEAAQAQNRPGAHAESVNALRQQAFQHYRAAAQLDPHTAGLQHSAGLMAMAAGNTEAALAFFRRAGELEPSNPQFPLFEAQVLIQLKQFDAAALALDRVLALDSNEPYAIASQAMIALERAQHEAALQHIRAACAIAPHDLGLRAQHARVLRRSGQPTRAIELLIGLAPEQRGQELIAFELASSFTDLNQHAKAAEVWQTCLETGGTSVDRAGTIALRVAQSLHSAGAHAHAVPWLAEAERRGADASQVRELRSQLATQLQHDPSPDAAAGPPPS